MKNTARKEKAAAAASAQAQAPAAAPATTPEPKPTAGQGGEGRDPGPDTYTLRGAIRFAEGIIRKLNRAEYVDVPVALQKLAMVRADAKRKAAGARQPRVTGRV